MLRHEIQMKFKLERGVTVFKTDPKISGFVLVSDITKIKPIDSLKIREGLPIYTKCEGQRFNMMLSCPESLEDLQSQIYKYNASTDIQIECYDSILHQFLPLTRLEQITPYTKMKLIPSGQYKIRLSQVLEENDKLRENYKKLENQLEQIRRRKRHSLRLIEQNSHTHVENAITLSQENTQLKNSLEKVRQRDIRHQGVELKSEPWGLISLSDQPDWKRVSKLCFKATIPELEADVKKWFFETVPMEDVQVTNIEFFRNVCLQTRFEATLMIMSEQHEIAGSPMYERWATTPEKTAVLKRFSDHYHRVSTNERIKVVRTWVGISSKIAETVCNTGLADLRKTDKGYFGAGIYSTLQANYALQYAEGLGSSKDIASDQEYCLLLCWVAVGNVYPISRDVDYAHGAYFSRFYDHENGYALKPGFDSHCVCVYTEPGKNASSYQAANKFDPEKNLFPQDPKALVDEIVVKESSQILPYCCVHYKHKDR